MAVNLSTYDNNVGAPLVLVEGQRADLERLAGKSLKELVDGETGASLLVFPEGFDKHGDEIGKSHLFDLDGDKLVTGNLMGFVGVGDTMLKIGSRFDRGRKDFFMHYMLERVLSINLFDLDYSTSQEEIFDFLPFLFPYYLKKAMSQGLYKEYRTFERNDAHMRGVLDVGRHIRLNYPATGRIAYRTREYTHDNAVTQLVRHTVEHIATTEYAEAILARDEDVKAFVAQVKAATPSYDMHDRQHVISANLRPRIHPFYSEYEGLRRLCLQILRHEAIRYGADDDAVHGVIFDGSWLWEEYLATVFVPSHASGSDGIKDFLHAENRKSKNGIPLFVDGGKRYPDYYGPDIVLDAKYKGYGGSHLTDDKMRDDVHQVVTYMYLLEDKKGGLIFPYPEGSQLASDDSAQLDSTQDVSAQADSVCSASFIVRDSQELHGYGGKMQLLGLPISPSLDYSAFKAAMAASEADLRVAILKLMA